MDCTASDSQALQPTGAFCMILRVVRINDTRCIDFRLTTSLNKTFRISLLCPLILLHGQDQERQASDHDGECISPSIKDPVSHTWPRPASRVSDSSKDQSSHLRG